MTVAELEARMDCHELREWIAFYAARARDQIRRQKEAERAAKAARARRRR